MKRPPQDSDTEPFDDGWQPVAQSTPKSSLKNTLFKPDANDAGFCSSLPTDSALKRRWRLADIADSEILKVRNMAAANGHELPWVTAEILARRGYGDSTLQAPKNHNLNSFLSPKIRDLMPDPDFLPNMTKAAARLATAIIQGEKIGMLGDYDVDGVTSTAILHSTMQPLFSTPMPFVIPHRILDGFGASQRVIDSLLTNDIQVLVTLDCGTASKAVLEAVQNTGIDVIILDHHSPLSDSVDALPVVYALVNPKCGLLHVTDSDPPYAPQRFTSLCTAGLSFCLSVAIMRELRLQGYFDESNTPEPNLWSILPLVALGTVADVMELQGFNRALVQKGLEVLNSTSGTALHILAEVAGHKGAFTAYTFGFLLGPRINAYNRIGDSLFLGGDRECAEHFDPSLPVKLLLSFNSLDAWDMAAALDKANTHRKGLEKHCQADALAALEAHQQGRPLPPELADIQIFDSPFFTMIAGAWHPGIVGIMAGRLKEQLQRPVCVLGLQEKVDTQSGESIQLAKGSGRSVAGADLGAALGEVLTNDGLLDTGGGHGMAIGLSFKRDKFAQVATKIETALKRQLDNAPPQPLITIDAIVSIAAADIDVCAAITQLEPFGNGNPEPMILIADATISHIRVLGSGNDSDSSGQHLQVTLKDTISGASLAAMAFRAGGMAVGNALQAAYASGKAIAVIGQLKENSYNNRTSAQLIIADCQSV